MCGKVFDTMYLSHNVIPLAVVSSVCIYSTLLSYDSVLKSFYLQATNNKCLLCPYINFPHRHLLRYYSTNSLHFHILCHTLNSYTDLT
jgi:hypothetical protein